MAHIEGPMDVAPLTLPIDGSGASTAIWGPDGDLVALVWENLGLDAAAEDTAALFAAAPDLLEDLKLATRSVRILGEMLQGSRRKDSKEIEAAVERMARYESTIKKAMTRHIPHTLDSI